MANFFGNTNGQPSIRAQLEHKIAGARSNLLFVVIFSAINILLLVTQSNMYFLFSATIPYLLVNQAMFFCGLLPDEYYVGEYAGMDFVDKSFLIVMIVIATLMVAVYLACWFLSKKHGLGSLIAALAAFALDTAGMFLFLTFSTSLIIDIVFHVWVIVSLASGIRACLKLKELPEEAPAEAVLTDVFESSPDGGAELASMDDSAPLRVADMTVKARILLECNAAGHHVIYRRVKRTNELVIDGNVYAILEMLAEPPHNLSARISGHSIDAGFDGVSSYIALDGQIIAKKLRLI